MLSDCINVHVVYNEGYGWVGRNHELVLWHLKLNNVDSVSGCLAAGFLFKSEAPVWKLI